jgi:hypothetical protein
VFIYACDYEARRRRGWGPGRLSGGDAMSDVSPVATWSAREAFQKVSTTTDDG